MAKSPEHFWIEARKIADASEKRVSTSKNVFCGTVHYDRALIAGVPVCRMTVVPPGSAWPKSYAIDAASRQPWKTLKKPPSGLRLSWRQESESRWLVQWSITPEVQCWGLGERYGGMNLRGRVHTLFATDNDQHIESTDSLYKSIPMLTLVEGETAYAVFLDSPALQRWDLDSTRNGAVSVTLLSRRAFTLYWFESSSLPDIVAAYTHLTGRCDLPPRWSLGHQQSRWSYPTEQVVRNIAKEFRTRKIPCDAIVLDIDYMDDYRVFTISRERFPRFERLVADVSKMGFRVVTIVDPGVAKSPSDATFREGRRLNAFCTKADGSLFVGKVWPGAACLPDFINVEVRNWWGDKLDFLLSKGVAGIWNDMNEPALFGNQRPLSADARELPSDQEQLFVQHDSKGTVGHFEVRNVYGQQMALATHDAMRRSRPNERLFALTRSGYAGIQRYSAVWLGDNASWFEHLRASIPMLLNIGLSGVAFCGVDIGGFGGNTDAELLVRWYQLGIFYPFCRNHCALNGRAQEPWSFGPEVEKAIRRLLSVRYRLLPYFEQLFAEHRQCGAPLMRPMAWHYPSDSTARQIDDQFMFGSDILVAPILQRGKSRRPVYLPKGRWFRFDGGPALRGGRFYDVEYRLDSTPAFVKEGAILPMASPVVHTGQLATAAITFRCFGIQAKGRYWQDDGSTLGYERGEYNDWMLSFSNHRFTSKSIHRGFEPVARPYFYETAGRRHQLRDWPPTATSTD